MMFNVPFISFSLGGWGTIKHSTSPQVAVPSHDSEGLCIYRGNGFKSISTTISLTFFCTVLSFLICFSSIFQFYRYVSYIRRKLEYQVNFSLQLVMDKPYYIRLNRVHLATNQNLNSQNIF